MRKQIIPWALTGVDLGDDVVEVGPGYGATTDVLLEIVPRLTSVEIDPDLAAALRERFAPSAGRVEVVEGDATALAFADGRFTGATSFSMLHHVRTRARQDQVFAEVRRVLRPSGVFVAVDSLASDDLRAFHDGDTDNPIDPDSLVTRLTAVGFATVEVATSDEGGRSSPADGDRRRFAHGRVVVGGRRRHRRGATGGGAACRGPCRRRGAGR